MAQLSIFRGGRLEGVFYLPDKPVLIGRADGVDIQLLDSRVSRRHAVIRESVAGFIIQDLDTKNGTFVNEEAIERSLLFHSDAIVIGGYTLKFLEEEEVDASALDSGFVAPLPEEGLRVPQALAGRGPNPQSQTNARAGGPPKRVDRLERRRMAGRQAREAVARATQGPTPVVEGGAPGSPGRKKANFTLDFSLSEFDSGGDPDSAPPGHAQANAGNLSREARPTSEVPARSGRPEIREITEGVSGIRFAPDSGSTTFGFSDRDDVRLRGGGRGTLFIVRRRGNEVEVRSGSSLRPLLLNGAPVVSAEAFPGDVFEVGGRSFEIGLSLGEEAAPGAETAVGIDAAALEAAIHARLGNAVPVADRKPPPPDPIGPASPDTETAPRALVEESDEWVADSLRDAPAVSPAVAAAEEGPPVVVENVPIEADSVSDVPTPVDVPLGANSGTMPRVSDTLRTRVVGPGRRSRRAPAPGSAFLPPVDDSVDNE